MLREKDLKAFNQAVLDLHTTQAVGEFPSQVHRAIRFLIGGDMSMVDWIDPRKRISLACDYYPGVVSDELNAFAHTVVPEEMPNWLRCADEPHSISDFLSRSAWEKRGLFQLFREISQHECLLIDVPLFAGLTLTLADLRGKFGGYTKAERLKFLLLRPHIRQVYRRLAAQGEVGGDRESVRRQARVSIDTHGNGRNWTRESRALLAAHGLTVVGRALPDAVRRWFLAQRLELEKPGGRPSRGVRPLCLERPDRLLRIFLRADRETGLYHLALQESRPASKDRQITLPGVSRRENEVLRWLVLGKTNSEIAMILGVSPGTVKRHLENVYPKLGVENRHAAMQLVVQRMNDQARAAVLG